MSSYVNINTSDIFNTQIGGQDYDAPQSSNTGLIISSIMCLLLWIICVIAIALFYYYYYYKPEQEENKTPTTTPVPAPLILA